MDASSQFLANTYQLILYQQEPLIWLIYYEMLMVCISGRRHGILHWEIHQLQTAWNHVVLSSASQKVGHDHSWVGYAWIDKPLDDVCAILTWRAQDPAFLGHAVYLVDPLCKQPFLMLHLTSFVTFFMIYNSAWVCPYVLLMAIGRAGHFLTKHF